MAAVVWLTGLSGAGKSTLAAALESAHRAAGRTAELVVLDGDALRAGLNADLGFSRADRAENVRRLAHVARLFVDRGTLVVVAAISPFSADRAAARRIVGPERFIEVWLSAPFSVCEARDPKGLYAKARAGQVALFTGKDQEYEAPTSPELALDTSGESVRESLRRLAELLRARGITVPEPTAER